MHVQIFTNHRLRIKKRWKTSNWDHRHVKFSKKKCGTARDDKLSTSNFHARATRLRHLHNGFKKSFQGDGMDNSNKHC